MSPVYTYVAHGRRVAEDGEPTQSVGYASLSVVFLLTLEASGQFLSLCSWCRTVVCGFHRKGTRALGERMEACCVPRKFRKRHQGFNLRHAGRKVVRALHLTAAGGNVPGDGPHDVVGGCHDDLHNGFEKLRLRLSEGVKHGFAAGGDEGDFLTVHRVRFAVVDRDADVFDGIAREVPRGEHFAHALFNGGDEVERNDAALDFVDKLKAFAACERLYFPSLSV